MVNLFLISVTAHTYYDIYDDYRNNFEKKTFCLIAQNWLKNKNKSSLNKNELIDFISSFLMKFCKYCTNINQITQHFNIKK